MVLFLQQLNVNSCLRFYYYTAGTGGAGPTILATSFLLLGEEVVAYNKGQCQLKLVCFVYVICRFCPYSGQELMHHMCLEAGEKLKLKPYSGMLNIDFGIGIGKRDVFLL